MKAVILAGGFGTRISEESGIKPKPMVEIGGMPILWHIMKIYSHWGINDFIICLGYKGYIIKEFFANYMLNRSDLMVDLKLNQVSFLNNAAEPWKVSLIDTGQNSMTGGRLKRIREFVGNQTFCMTYGDGLSDVNLQQLIDFHRSQNVLTTLTAVQEEGRFGTFSLEDDQNKVTYFREKPKDRASAWINGGFFVLEPEIFDMLEGDDTVFERGPLEQLSKTSNLAAFRHEGFWMPMDTLRDKMVLEKLWSDSSAPWKVW